MSVNIPKLKIRRKKARKLAPCALEMAALATCWASFATDDKRCAATSKALTACMQKRHTLDAAKSNINYHLARLGPQVLGK